MNCLSSSPIETKTMKDKKQEALWHGLMINRWLRRKSSGEKFNTDKLEIDGETPETENETDGEGRRLISESSTDSYIERAAGISIRSSNRPRQLVLDINTREYKILVTTWNVGGVIPPSDLELEDCLNLKEEESDIYVLGFQEIVPLKAGNVLGSEDRGPAMKWDTLIRKTLNRTPNRSTVTPTTSCSAPPSPAMPALIHLRRTRAGRRTHAEITRYIERYNRVASKQMVGIFISVWVRSELRRHIHDLQISSVARGIMGRLGNKGSISVRMSLHQTTFCFICTHLAAGEKEGDELRRNFDVSEIMKRTHFPRTTSELLDLPQTILGHDRIIWFGDLNYRLASPDANIILSLIQKGEWETLFESDQLKMEQAAGRVFEGWQEGSIAFAPTYKYAANSDRYSAFIENKAGQKRRNPAWCDRILSFGRGLKQLSYTRGECRLSDHRPVTAVFLVDVQVLVSHRQNKKLQDFSNKIQLELDQYPKRD